MKIALKYARALYGPLICNIFDDTNLCIFFRIIVSDNGFINSCLLFIIFNIILFADFGPRPGSFDINFIKLFKAEIFCIKIIYKGHLNPGILKPPAALDISSEVLDLS